MSRLDGVGEARLSKYGTDIIRLLQDAAAASKKKPNERVGNLYGRICDTDNIRLAFYKAARRKHDRPEMINFKRDFESNYEQSMISLSVKSRIWASDPTTRTMPQVPTDSLTLETHEKALFVAERYGFSIYDSMIIAAAILGNCEILYSEDMQDGRLIDHQLRILYPFKVF